MVRRLMMIAVLATVAGVTVLGAELASATAPGANGRIAFARDDPASPGNSFTFTANADGSDLRPLFPGHHSQVPHFSPDGTKVAVLSDAAAAVIIDPSTGTHRIIAMPEPKRLFTPCTIWSPNGARLACEGQGKTDPSLNGIYTIRSSDGGGLTRITSIRGGDDNPIDYSPDGTRLVFGRTDPSRPAGANAALFIVDVAGGPARRITPWGYSDDDGSWSPDGTRIAFEHSGSLFVVHPDGTGLTKVALAIRGQTIAGAGDFSWSPDGRKILFLLGVRDASGTLHNGIATANSNGTNIHWVTHSPTFDHQGNWGSRPRTRAAAATGARVLQRNCQGSCTPPPGSYVLGAETVIPGVRVTVPAGWTSDENDSGEFNLHLPGHPGGGVDSG